MRSELSCSCGTDLGKNILSRMGGLVGWWVGVAGKTKNKAKHTHSLVFLGLGNICFDLPSYAYSKPRVNKICIRTLHRHHAPSPPQPKK